MTKLKIIVFYLFPLKTKIIFIKYNNSQTIKLIFFTTKIEGVIVKDIFSYEKNVCASKHDFFNDLLYKFSIIHITEAV